MHERALREALEEYAARRLPADPDLWPAIRARAAAYRRPGQPGGAPPAGQGARSGAVTGAARRWRPPRLAAVADVAATLLLLVAVALVLALMLPGMTGQRERGGLGAGPSPTPTPAPPPPGQPFPVPADCPVTPELLKPLG